MKKTETIFSLPVVIIWIFLIPLSFQKVSAQSKHKKQISSQSKQKKYTREEVLDTLQGIVLYNKLIPALGGDSVRLQKNGTALEGWQEDFYVNGKTLHKGLYKHGQLEIFRNFYDNGKTERVFAVLDSQNCNLDIYYENGNQRNQINYYKGKIKRSSEFYENGLLKQSNEFDVMKDLLLSRKNWYPGGALHSEISCDRKSGKYYQKTYHSNGKLYEQGTLILDKEKGDLLRNGTWTTQDSTGKNKKTLNFKATKKASN